MHHYYNPFFFIGHNIITTRYCTQDLEPLVNLLEGLSSKEALEKVTGGSW